MSTLLPETTALFAPYEKRLTRASRALKTFKTIDASIDYHMKLSVAFMKRAHLLSPELLDSSVQIALIDADNSRDLLDVMTLADFDTEPLELKGDESKD